LGGVLLVRFRRMRKGTTGVTIDHDKIQSEKCSDRIQTG